jgi:electron transport complex protein RnfD
MWSIFGCALAVSVYSAAGDGFASLGIAIAVLAAALFSEALALHFGRLWSSSADSAPSGEEPAWIAGGRLVGGKIADGSAAASAMIFVLLLPNSINPVYAVLGILFAMLLVKFSFGGLGANWVNPALGAWLFLRLSWPSLFSRIPLEFQGGGGSGLDAAVRGFFNRTVLSLIGAELPPGYVDLILGLKGEGIIADRGLPILILGTIILISAQISRAWIPAVYLGVYALLVRIFGAASGALGGGDVLYCLFSGGTLAAAFFLAADPVTGAKSGAGMLGAAVLSAVLAFLFRYQGSDPYGAFPAAALVNAAVPFIRRLENRKFPEPIFSLWRLRK